MAVILIRLPSSIASGFGGLFTFFAFRRNGYFKIESRSDARLTLPKVQLKVYSGFVRAKSRMRYGLASAIRTKTTRRLFTVSFENENPVAELFGALGVENVHGASWWNIVFARNETSVSLLRTRAKYRKIIPSVAISINVIGRCWISRSIDDDPKLLGGGTFSHDPRCDGSQNKIRSTIARYLR